MFLRPLLSHEADLEQDDAAAYADMLEVVSFSLWTFSASTDQSESVNLLRASS